MLSLIVIFFSSTKFPPLFLRLHHISFKCIVQQLICRSQGAEISTLSQEKKCRYPRCLVGYCLSKVAKICTQTQAIQRLYPGIQGKKKLTISGCRNWHVDLGNSPTIIFYHDFCRRGFGVLDFEIQDFYFFCRSFGLGDPVSVASAHPSHNNILFYILSKYQPKKKPI